eukprot:1802671-Alexandrium_andersonii.AAC.1
MGICRVNTGSPLVFPLGIQCPAPSNNVHPTAGLRQPEVSSVHLCIVSDQSLPSLRRKCSMI